jgi:hypothetical protein
MPTATLVSQATLTNLGPLTTTFTQAASCATVASNVVYGFREHPEAIAYSSDCTFTPYTDCLPSYDLSRVSPISEAATPALRSITYYSPGIYCPSGWSTVGVAAKAGDGLLSTTGIFNPTSLLSTPLPTVFVAAVPVINVLMEVIDKGETAVLCCPGFVPPPTPQLGAGSIIADMTPVAP